ncbi:unnamed protein product [Aureobasidium uvarum]|uniref:Uncharacterized protein n=1 Tax=Aureobasidium uvarum TaxID=2773716 RepID=A0A9N8KF61_9PEZI|nr:unnamed protein product [Aureobasidium uvarum]
MSERNFEEPITISLASIESPETLPQPERRGSELCLPLADEDALVLPNPRDGRRAGLIRTCLHKGVWTMTDEELNIIIHGFPPEQKPSLEQIMNFRNRQTPELRSKMDDLGGPDGVEEFKAISQCYKEQGCRREAARATRQLHRYHLVRRRYQELIHDDLQQDKPAKPSYSLKRKAFEQIMRETKGQNDFPSYPTNISTSQKIQNFAIKAQRKPYYDIGIWGFAVLRLNYSDDQAWESFKVTIEEAAQKRLQGSEVPEHIRSMFRFTYLEDSSALSGPVDQAKLVKYWDQNKWNEDVHMHINRQIFISAEDIEAQEGENPNDPRIYLHDASVEGDDEGFPGFMRASVFDLFLWHIAGMEKSHLHLRSMWETLNSQ